MYPTFHNEARKTEPFLVLESRLLRGNLPLRGIGTPFAPIQFHRSSPLLVRSTSPSRILCLAPPDIFFLAISGTSLTVATKDSFLLNYNTDRQR